MNQANKNTSQDRTDQYLNQNFSLLIPGIPA